jgi:acetyl esterase/lipase
MTAIPVGQDVTGTRQLKAWHERVLPPVEKLASDLWLIPCRYRTARCGTCPATRSPPTRPGAARRVAAAGTSVELHVHPGCPHGFDRIDPNVDVVRRARADRLRALKSY